MAKSPGLPSSDVVPPHSIEAEQSLLGAMLVERECAERFTDALDHAAFYRDTHQVIFLAVRRLIVAGSPTDIVTLPQALKDSGQLEAVGGIAYVMALFDALPTAANADYYAKIVREKAALRRIMAAGLEVFGLAQNEEKPADELIAAAESAVYDLREKEARSTGDTLAQVIVDFEIEMQQSSESDGGMVGQRTGMEAYDAYANGAEGNTLIVWAARPSMGKTSMLTTAAVGLGADGGRPGLFISAEPLRKQVLLRMLCAEGELDSRVVKNGQMNEDEWARYEKAKARIASAQLYIDDKKHPTPAHVRSLARRVRSLYGDLGFICVDYLQLMRADRPTDNKVNDLGSIAYALKDLSGELNIPVIALAQLSRNVETRDNKRPMMSDLRASGEIEEAADIVCGIYREEYYTMKGKEDVDTSRLQEVELLFLKQRDGGTGMVKVGFVERYTRFVDLPSGSAGSPGYGGPTGF